MAPFGAIPPIPPPLFQRRRDDNRNNICAFEGDSITRPPSPKSHDASPLPYFRDGETTIEIKFALLRGVGLGGGEENRPKTLFFVRGKRHDNTILKVQILLSRHFVVIAQAPTIARYGVFGVSTWPIGCDTPSPFSERFPIGEHAKWRCDTPPQKGYLSDTCAITYENKANGCDTPSAILSRKGIARYGRGYLALGR